MDKVKIVLFTVMMLLLLSMVTGCQKEQVVIGNKQARFVAAENMRLKKELDACQKQVEEKKQLLEKTKKDHQKEIEKLEKDSTRIADFFIEQNKSLREENEQLKKELKQYKP